MADKIVCPICDSARIVRVRHDVDWSNGHDVYPVNPADCYQKEEYDEQGRLVSYGDIDENGHGSYGDIDFFACLECDFIWNRYGRDIMELLNRYVEKALANSAK